MNENKQLMQTILDNLSNGNYEPFFESMSDDIKWTWMGSKDYISSSNSPIEHGEE